MINWEELKHIHVIRKLEEILGQWFSTDVFFVDDKGQIKNYDPADKTRIYRNPICSYLFGSEPGKELVLKTIANSYEKAVKSDKTHFFLEGPLGIENILVSRIIVENDCLGHVFAYCFVDKEVSQELKQKAKAHLENLNISADGFFQNVHKLKILTPAEKKYLLELVDLVAQEIVTFHTEISKREEKINALNTQLGIRYSYHSMIGKAKPMQDLYTMLDKLKNSESTVLIQGENGTGKELIAKAIHFNSSRKDNQFVTVNCSAFNENLLDSELFGHVKGSFTGAIRDKKGLFEVADKGTLLLDEIGDMSPSMQVKLLRVIQEGTLTPVGGIDQKRVDVRVVAATNRDLKEMVEQGYFREDLYYRVNVINLFVPPLRNRKEDIPLLVEHFIKKGCHEKGLPLKNLAKRTFERIYDYPWPGNIRELENEIERLIVLSGAEEKINAEQLSSRIREFGEHGKMQGVRVAGKLKDALEELEKTMIREGLRRTGYNKSRLAKELGISRAGLIMKVEKYGLDKRRLPKLTKMAA